VMLIVTGLSYTSQRHICWCCWSWWRTWLARNRCFLSMFFKFFL